MPKKTLIALVLTLMIGLLNCAAMAETYPCEGVPNTLSVRVRKKATTSSVQVTTLGRGEVVMITEAVTKRYGDVWYRVETSKGRKGYVLSDHLSVSEKNALRVHRIARMACGCSRKLAIPAVMRTASALLNAVF